MMGGGGKVVWCLGVTEKREKWGRGCTALWRSEEGRRKNDLKAGHMRAKNECDRTYLSAFDHIRAECVWGY
jgi:hypothetical protein